MKVGLTVSTTVDFAGRRCNQCEKETISNYWCQPCNSSRFRKEFDNWKSGNDDIDEFIKEVQLNAASMEKTLEWIPYEKFEDMKLIGKGAFGQVHSADWTEGYILYWNVKDSQWKRKGNTKVALKYLDNSQNITNEFLNEIKNLYYCNDDSSRITRCYGITRDKDTKNFIIVMKLIEDGGLNRNLSEFQKMSLEEKLASLCRIAEGLYQIHEAKLVHRDFHSGNILFSRIRNKATYITDLGLCRPTSEFAHEKPCGVLPYMAPEYLCEEGYTKAADVYSFGVIISEVLSGIPPFHNVSHDKYLVLKICNENLRPRIPRNAPALIIELIQKCWDADPQERLRAFELRTILKVWRCYKEQPDSELAEQIKEKEDMAPDSVEDIEIHPGAIYTSRCSLEF